MEFLNSFLPIIIYFLIIIMLIVGIVLGIKIIITIVKVEKVVDDINEKVERITPIFDALGIVSSKTSEIIEGVVGVVEKIISKLFLRSKNEKETNEDE